MTGLKPLNVDGENVKVTFTAKAWLSIITAIATSTALVVGGFFKLDNRLQNLEGLGVRVERHEERLTEHDWLLIHAGIKSPAGSKPRASQ